MPSKALSDIQVFEVYWVIHHENLKTDPDSEFKKNQLSEALDNLTLKIAVWEVEEGTMWDGRRK